MKKRIPYLLRIIIGIIFIISAFSKLFSIDTFEIYIFSFELFGLGLSYLIARLLITLELAIGLWLIINIDSKWAYYLTHFILWGFTIFLSVLIIKGNKGNCNCFGEFINMNPGQSIIKNLILIILLILSRKCYSFNIKFKPLYRIILPVLSLSIVLISSPPDNWRYKYYSKDTSINAKAFEDAFKNDILKQEIKEGEKIVCFYSLKCNFCKMSAQKIGTMRRMKTFSNAEIIVVFGGNPSDPSTFFKNNKLDCKNYFFISPEDFLRITNGKMPLILVMKEGKIIQKFSYRDIR